jgi:hypothetical protein
MYIPSRSRAAPGIAGTDMKLRGYGDVLRRVDIADTVTVVTY